MYGRWWLGYRQPNAALGERIKLELKAILKEHQAGR
jgi:hypothetical protein